MSPIHVHKEVDVRRLKTENVGWLGHLYKISLLISDPRRGCLMGLHEFVFFFFFFFLSLFFRHDFVRAISLELLLTETPN